MSVVSCCGSAFRSNGLFLATASVVLTFVFDSLVYVFTVKRTYKLIRLNAVGRTGSTVSLLSLMFRDGEFGFLIFNSV